MYRQEAFDGRHSQLTAAVSLGGDGTFLRMARDMVKYNVPVFGVNFGHLGFLAEIEYDTLRQALQLLSDGRYTIEKRCLLAAQTFAGSGKMVLETGKHPAVLRDMVTSPGGTTIAGIKALENGAVRGALYNAVQAVLDRSEELKKH